MSLSPAFENGLNKLSMLSEDRGLYFLKDNIQKPHVQIHIEEAKKYKPTAIYVTEFENGSVKPQIYIYDNTSNKLTEEQITEEHKRLWNAYKVPMFFVFTNTEVKVYNCLQKPNINEANGQLENITPFETIQLLSKITEEFQATMFDSGAFWNSKYKDNFSFSSSVYESLLNELKDLRENLISKEILSPKTTESLLIKTILLRYLEERGVFEEGIENKKPYWAKFKKGATSFTDLFDDSKAVIALLDDLNEHFNGGVFDIGEEDSEERNELLKADLKEFQYFLKGNKEGNQLVFWSRYSFKDLPIELISNIYELFLKSEDKAKGGVVYTPPILVNFMIDEIMPLDKPQKNFKLIDPSCGSGIFLVGAYKRLIQWWMIENDWKKPSTTIAKNIITNSIYGVDKEEGAVQLSIFSLALALCDTFLPDTIWRKLQFDNLKKSKNILELDFFEYIEEENEYIEKVNHNKFDLVIGNPPFVSKYENWTNTAKELEKEELFNRPKINNKNLELPNKQLALFFLEQSFKLLKTNSFLAMVQYAPGFLYNKRSSNFRNYIFEQYKCHQIVDFSAVKNLFNTANVSVATVFMQKIKPNIKEDLLLHLTVRQTFLVQEKIYFDLSHYDFHWVTYNDVLKKYSIWKANLLGGSRIHSIISRLQKYGTLKEFLDNKEKNNNWLYRSGFVVGKGKKANFLTNQWTLPVEAFSEDGIDYSKIKKLRTEEFQATRPKEFYEPPLILFKEIIGKKGLIMEYVNRTISFKKGIVGIHAPMKYKVELKELFNNLKEKGLLYRFYLTVTSGRAGVSKATAILKQDIDLLPYSDKVQDLTLSKVEEYFVNDTLDYMIDLSKGNTNSLILNGVTDKQLDEFQSVYCELLNTTYDDFKLLNRFETQSFVGCSFYYKDKPTFNLLETSTELERNLSSIINHKTGQNVNIKRVLRFYDGHVIYIIKPKEYRFWLKSIAVRDADETFADLVQMGY